MGFANGSNIGQGSDRVLDWLKQYGRNMHDVHSWYIRRIALWCGNHETPLAEVEQFLAEPRLRLMDARDYINRLSHEELDTAIAEMQDLWGIPAPKDKAK